MQSLPKRWLTVLGAAGLVAMLVPGPAAANHPQTSGAFAITFDHDGDNEWWVEVLTQTSGGDSIVLMEVRQESSGTFRGLEHKGVFNGWIKWGPHEAFRIPPGDRVIFRAHMVDGATGAGGMVESCWFTHPAGAEQCSTTPPPPLWPTTIVGDAGSPSAGGGDMALGDADNDGQRDVTIGTWAGIYTFERQGSVWARQRVGTVEAVGAVAAGDGDGDGTREIYAVSDGRLVQARSVAGAWSERTLLTLPRNPSGQTTTSGDMTLGNIDGVAGPEIYVAIGHVDCDPEGLSGCFTTSYVFRVAFESGTWRATEVSTSGGNIRSMWIGDGDSDGDSELYVGRTSRHAEGKTQVERVNGVWQTSHLPGWSGTGNQVVVGDVDRDGRTEVYTASFTGDIGLISYDPATGNWTHRVVVTLAGGEPASLFIGDADNDGRQDLYVGQGDGQVAQVRYLNGQWVATTVARISDSARGPGAVAMLVVGDGDGDGRGEVYAGVLFGTHGDLLNRVYRIGEPATTGFDATFTSVRGNEWWVQANVAATGGTLSKVDVRLNGGEWKPLAKQSWGGWAASYRIVQGTTVQFRATSTLGATDASDCYRWIPPPNTDAAKTTCGSPPPPPAFDATFSGVKGNNWWVQVNVAANQPVAQVMARVDCALHWTPLAKQSWGGWAASFHVPSGAKVDFQARTSTFDSDVSGGYIWTAATPTSGCPQGDWPRHGSTATYDLTAISCGQGQCEESRATLQLRYDQGRWLGVCHGTDTFRDSDGSVIATETWTSNNDGLAPSRESPSTAVGRVHHPDMFHTSYNFNQCSMGWVNSPVTVLRQDAHLTELRDGSGQRRTLQAWYAESTNAEDNLYTAHWDTKVGLVLDIDSFPRRSGHGSAHMDLVATNAPLG